MRSHRLFLVSTFLAVGVHGQWLNHPSPGTPRTKDGKANLAANAPRAANGKPDLSGVWRVVPTPDDINRMLSAFGDYTALIVPGDDPRTFHKYFMNILADFQTGGRAPATRCSPIAPATRRADER